MKEQRATGTKLTGVFQNTSELVFMLNFIIGSSDFSAMAAVDKADRSANVKMTALRQSHCGLTSVTTGHLCKESALEVSRGFFVPKHRLLFFLSNSTIKHRLIKKNSTYACLLLVSRFLSLATQKTREDMKLTEHLLCYGRTPRAIIVVVSSRHDTKPKPTEQAKASLLTF